MAEQKCHPNAEFQINLYQPTPTGAWQYYDDTGKKLGQGVFGLVYKAQRISTGKFYAVKQVPVKIGLKHYVEREISIMKLLNHPNICQLEDVYRVSNPSLYGLLELSRVDIVLELVDNGVTIYQFAKSKLHEIRSKWLALAPKRVAALAEESKLARYAGEELPSIVENKSAHHVGEQSAFFSIFNALEESLKDIIYQVCKALEVFF